MTDPLASAGRKIIHSDEGAGGSDSEHRWMAEQQLSPATLWSERKSLQEVQQRLCRPLLLAAADAQERLFSLYKMATKSHNPVLLLSHGEQPRDLWYPMTRTHYLHSSIYLVARYLCWVEIYKQQSEMVLSPGGEAQAAALRQQLKAVERSLSSTACQSSQLNGRKIWDVREDRQIFRMQQAYLGQSLLGAQALSCLSYLEFLERYPVLWQNQPDFQALEQLLVRACECRPGDFSLRRCSHFANALVELIETLDPECLCVSREHRKRVKVPGSDFVPFRLRGEASP